MKFERISGIEHKMYKDAISLYDVSFPFHEKRERKSQAEILEDENYNFELIYDEKEFVGLLLYWETENFIYVEHFCVMPDKRNLRYGQNTLSSLQERGKTVILEIDPPEDTTSQRRKAFYERNGFESNPYSHIHPPYHEGCEGHKLVVMSYPDGLSEKEYAGFDLYLKERVMRRAF